MSYFVVFDEDGEPSMLSNGKTVRGKGVEEATELPKSKDNGNSYQQIKINDLKQKEEEK